ncbi:MAG: enoyl-CoA hydratase/isomerase family protein [Bacteroidetes bacterium]|nr:enoyl-CoA hydratase/isomerase family protein [Bacteroidota bacterium]
MNYIKTEILDRIAYIILNRPEKRNALNADFISELKTALNNLEVDNECRAVVIKSSGNVFCAGIDLAFLQKMQEFTYEQNLEDSKNLKDLFFIIYTFSKPVISLVNGPAIAGGCGLATVCDFCFATPESTFGYTESRIGFIPAIVLIFLRKKVNETISKKILLSGELFNADYAYEIGLITKIISAENIENEVHGFVRKLIENSSSNSMAMVKKMYSALDNLSMEQALDYACEMNAKTRETDDCRRGVSSFLNKTKNTW